MSEGHAEKNVVLRERALATIESAHEARVVVVTGAAGSGKSTLVRQWAQRLGPGRSVAWLTLDPADNNPSRWWVHLRAELLTAAPGLVWAPGSEADRESIELLLEELVAEHPDLVLVIDDLHFVVDPRVVAALDSLVAGLGPTMRLALVSRTRPTLRLARGVVAGDVVQVRGKDLLFSPEETRDALLARGVRSEDDIAALGDSGPPE